MIRSNRKCSNYDGMNSSTLPSYHYNQEAITINAIPSKHPVPLYRYRHRTKKSKGFPIIPRNFFKKYSKYMLLLIFSLTHLGVDQHLKKVVKELARKLLDLNPPGERRLEEVNLTNLTSIIPPKPQNDPYDVVVLGVGPAGLTAALFAARSGLSVLVLGSDAGSLSETNRLENFPGWELERGPLWLQTTKKQAAQWGATFSQAAIIAENIQTKKDDTFTLGVSGNLQLDARSVIVATGAKGRRLGLQYEDVLWGKSVHSCAVCDGSSYASKVVIVVGGGDSAIDGALLLARYAKQVVLVHRRREFRATNSRNVELLQSTPNILVKVPYTLKKFETYPSRRLNKATNNIEEYDLLTAVILQSEETHDTEYFSCEGVFELIGSTPNTDWLKGSGAELDSGGYLRLSNPSGETRMATTVKGLFAAGEVTDQIYRQAVTAASEGAQAAMDAERWLRKKPTSKYTNKEAIAKGIPLQNVLTQPLESMQQKEVLMVKSDTFEEAECDLKQIECIMKTVRKYPVVVFSKPWCPYCRKALEALAAEGLSEGNANLHVIDLTSLGYSAYRVQEKLQSMTGRRTVPNVFINGTSIGGGDETVSLHKKNKLLGMLVLAKAIDSASKTKDSSRNDLS